MLVRMVRMVLDVEFLFPWVKRNRVSRSLVAFVRAKVALDTLRLEVSLKGMRPCLIEVDRIISIPRSSRL